MITTVLLWLLMLPLRWFVVHKHIHGVADIWVLNIFAGVMTAVLVPVFLRDSAYLLLVLAKWALNKVNMRGMFLGIGSLLFLFSAVSGNSTGLTYALA